MERDEKFALIDNAFAEGKFSYTQEEMDLLFYIMHVIDAGRTEYTIRMKDIEEFSGKTRKSSRIKASFRSLGKRTYEIDHSDDEWEIYWLFRSVILKEGVISIKINEEILPLLCNLKKNYTLLELNGGFRLNGKYAKRLYLLLSRWKNLNSKIYEVAELMEILKFSNRAKQIVDFKRAVEKSVIDINTQTYLFIEVEWIKTGKAVTHVKFNIKTSKDVTGIRFDDPHDMFKSKRLLCACGLSAEQVERLYLEGCNYEKIKSIYDAAEKSLRRNDTKVDDPAAYLLSCFRNAGYLQAGKREKDRRKIEMYRELVASGTPIEFLRPVLKKEGLSEEDIIGK